MPAGWKHFKGKNVYKYVLFFAMCMTIGYFFRLSCITRLLLMTRLMSHLLSCFEVHLYHLFSHVCLQGRVGGCGWGGLCHHQTGGVGGGQIRFNIFFSIGGEGEAYEQMLTISHDYILTNAQLCTYVQHTASHTTTHLLTDTMFRYCCVLVPIAVFTGTRCHDNCRGCRNFNQLCNTTVWLQTKLSCNEAIEMSFTGGGGGGHPQAEADWLSAEHMNNTCLYFPNN